MSAPPDIEARLRAEIARHPLGPSLLAEAEAAGAALADPAAMALVVARSCPQTGDPRMMLLVAALLAELSRLAGAAPPPSTQPAGDA